MGLAEELRQARLRAKLSQVKIARATGMDTGMVSNVERGLKSTSFENVDAWLDACGERLAAVPKNAAAPAEVSALPDPLADIVLRLARVIRALPPGEREMLADTIDSAGGRHIRGYVPRSGDAAAPGMDDAALTRALEGLERELG